MRTVLIVDDDMDLLLALRIRLKSSGYAVLVASDAAVAIQKAIQDKPDLILLDIGLPDRNGFLVLDRLKQNAGHRSIPVIIVSARPSEVYKDAAVMAGAIAYFQKPFNNDEVLHAIAGALKPSFATP